ncbi:MAG: hypothetical protein ACO1SV_07615 [Fimbriimonas sp.]
MPRPRFLFLAEIRAARASMQEIGTNRTSGASLAMVALAIAGTAGYGAFARRKDAEESHAPRHPTHSYNFSLRLLEQGTGLAPVPTAPPAARWLKFELLTNGQAVHHRPVQFRKTARDASGRSLVTEHRWSGGYFYAFVRSGFRHSEGPVDLQISFRDRLVERLTLDPLPKAKRALEPVATKPRWPGLTAEVVRTPNDPGHPIAVRVDAPLGKDEALVVQPIGSSFLAEEPYGDPIYAKASPDGKTVTVPLAMGYPKEIDAISIRVSRVKARASKKAVDFGLRYSGGTDTDLHFTIRPSESPFAGGVMLNLSRFDRTVAVPRDGSRPLRLFVSSRLVAGRSRIRLLSPGSIRGVPIVLANRIASPEGLQEVAKTAADAPDVIPRIPDEAVPIRVELEVWQYEPVYEETLVIPFTFDRAPRVAEWNRYPLRHLR